MLVIAIIIFIIGLIAMVNDKVVVVVITGGMLLLLLLMGAAVSDAANKEKESLKEQSDCLDKELLIVCCLDNNDKQDRIKEILMDNFTLKKRMKNIDKKEVAFWLYNPFALFGGIDEYPKGFYQCFDEYPYDINNKFE